MKTNCEACGLALPAERTAYVCSYECTFCPVCTSNMHGICLHCGGELVRRPRLLMLPGLLQIRAVAGTIERHLALFAAALRTNPSMDRGAEAFLFSNVADGARQIGILLWQHYGIALALEVWMMEMAFMRTETASHGSYW